MASGISTPPGNVWQWPYEADGTEARHRSVVRKELFLSPQVSGENLQFDAVLKAQPKTA